MIREHDMLSNFETYNMKHHVQYMLSKFQTCNIAPSTYCVSTILVTLYAQLTKSNLNA